MLTGDRPALVGECRWQAKPITQHDVNDLRRRATHRPSPGQAGLTFAFWSRGPDETLVGHPEVRSFTPANIMDGD